MRFKKMMRGIALLLMTVLLSVSVCPLVSHADKISDLKKSIQDKQDAIDKAQNEKKSAAIRTDGCKEGNIRSADFQAESVKLYQPAG